jgi:hypothetical protein
MVVYLKDEVRYENKEGESSGGCMTQESELTHWDTQIPR